MSGKQPSVTALQNELNRVAQDLAAIRKELSLKNELLEMSDQRQQSMLQSIFDSVDIGLLLIDSHGKVRKVNNAITLWLGNDNPATGSKPGDILHCVNAFGDSEDCGHSENCLECPLRIAFETAQKTNHPVDTIQAKSELTIDGDVQNIWFDIRAHPLLIDDEHYVILSLINVSEHKRVEEAHRQSEEFLRQSHERLVLAQQAAGSGVWNWDLVTGKLVWAPELFRLFGLDEEKDQANFEIWRSIIHPEDLELAERRIEESIRNRTRLNNEYRIVLPTGDIRWINAIGDTVYDPTGTVLRMSGICLDISDRKLAEELIQRQIRELQDANDELFRFNQAAVGREKRIIELKEQVNELCIRIGQPPRYSLPDNLDSIEQYEVTNFQQTLMDSRKAALNLMEDALEAQGKAEQLSSDLAALADALQQSQNDLNRAQAVAQTGSWRLDIRNNILTWSDENHRIFGIPKGVHLTYDTFLNIIHPDDRDFVDTRWKAGMRGEHYDIEHRIIVDNKIKWVRETANLEYSKHGELMSAFGITQDITALKNAVESLEFREKQYRALFEGMSEGFALHEMMFDVDMKPIDYMFLDVNPAFERLTGLKRTDLVGKRLSQVLPTEYSRWLKKYGEVALTGNSVRFTQFSQALNRHFEVFAYRPAMFQFAVIFIDITQRIEMENKLQHLASFPNLNPNPVLELDTNGSLLFVNNATNLFLEGIGCKNQVNLFLPPDIHDIIDAFSRETRVKPVHRDVQVGTRIFAETINHVKQTNTIRIYSTDVTSRIRARERIKKLNATLDERVRDRTEKLRSMALELTLVEQRERKRLATILHDHLQQLLVASKLGLAVANNMTDITGFQKAIQRVSDLLDESITTSRNLAIELSPPVLNEIGLGAALKWMGQWMKEKHDLDVCVSIDNDLPADPKGICYLLFEAVRELLFNVVKHAQTGQAEVVMETYPDGLVKITVTDKGTGFDSPVKTADLSDTGFGLFSIRERLSLVGGQLEITSSKNSGTTAVLSATIRQP